MRKAIKAKQSHSFRQSKSKDGIGEQLLFQLRISGITDDQTAKHCSNSSSRTSNSYSGSTSTSELCCSFDISVSHTSVKRLNIFLQNTILDSYRSAPCQRRDGLWFDGNTGSIPENREGSSNKGHCFNVRIVFSGLTS